MSDDRYAGQGGQGDDGYRDPYDEENKGYDDEPEVARGISPVAIAPGKSLIVLILGVTILGFVAYKFIFSDDKTDKADANKQVALPGPVPLAPEQIADVQEPPPPEPVATQISVPAPIVLPDPPPMVAPAPPPPPPPLPVPAQQPVGEVPKEQPGGAVAVLIGEDVGNTTKETQTENPESSKKKAGSLVFGGGGSNSSLGQVASAPSAGQPSPPTAGAGGGAQKPVASLFGEEDGMNAVPITQADQAEATRIRDMNNTVAQGKMIEAVLETAINTDLPGMLRAVVSEDVYAEAGRNILIPKGSRLVGNYESTVKRGQSRVYIIWGRVIRPDGIDIAIDSPGVDQLGRAGVSGRVDNKYLQIFGSAFLLSALTTTAVIAAEQFSNSQGISETETEGGNVRRSGKVSDLAINEAVKELSGVGKDVVNDFLDVQPTINVSQGTRVKVFVNRDLIFPANIVSNVKFIR